MALVDFEDFAEPPLAIPIQGKSYLIRPVGIRDGLRLAGVLSGDDKALADHDSIELWQLLLGPTWDALMADNVPIQAAARVGMTALINFQQGRAVAEAYWNSGVDPLRLAAQARAAQTSSNTGAATTTKQPASTSGTSSPRGNRRKRSQRGPSSRGSASPSNGS